MHLYLHRIAVHKLSLYTQCDIKTSPTAASPTLKKKLHKHKLHEARVESLAASVGRTWLLLAPDTERQALGFCCFGHDEL